MSLPCGTFNPTYEKDMAIVRTGFQWGVLAVFLVLLFVLPLFAGNYVLRLGIGFATTIIAVHGLNIMTGYCGQISVGHAAFISVGGYASAYFMTKAGLPFWVALPGAGIVAGIVGLFFGLPSLRVKGFYLALATLAAQFIIDYSKIHLGSITGGTYGLHAPAPILGAIVFDSVRSYYYIAITAVILMTYFAKNLVRTRIGRAFIAVRDNDLAAEVMGVNLYRYKLLAFFIGCFFAGIAGSIWAHSVGVIHPEEHTLMDSIWLLGMVIVGGMGSIVGTIFGVIFLKGLIELFSQITPMITEILPSEIGGAAVSAGTTILYALVIILFLVFEPRGLAHRWEVSKASFRLWPFIN